MNTQYIQRILAVPLSLAGGFAAKELAQNVNIGQLGITKNSVSHAVVVGAAYLIGMVITYLSHHKGLDSITKTVVTDTGAVVATTDKLIFAHPESAITPDAVN